jgi:hypothetical protein
MRRFRGALFLVAILAIVAAKAPADASNAGCFNCVTDYGDCQFLTGLCSEVCEQVGHEQSGDGIWCAEDEFEPWTIGGGNTVCELSGGACYNVESNGNDDPPEPGGWCPWGQTC